MLNSRPILELFLRASRAEVLHIQVSVISGADTPRMPSADELVAAHAVLHTIRLIHLKGIRTHPENLTEVMAGRGCNSKLAFAANEVLDT